MVSANAGNPLSQISGGSVFLKPLSSWVKFERLPSAPRAAEGGPGATNRALGKYFIRAADSSSNRTKSPSGSRWRRSCRFRLLNARVDNRRLGAFGNTLRATGYLGNDLTIFGYWIFRFNCFSGNIMRAAPQWVQPEHYQVVGATLEAARQRAGMCWTGQAETPRPPRRTGLTRLASNRSSPAQTEDCLAHTEARPFASHRPAMEPRPEPRTRTWSPFWGSLIVASQVTPAM